MLTGSTFMILSQVFQSIWLVLVLNQDLQTSLDLQNRAANNIQHACCLMRATDLSTENCIMALFGHLTEPLSRETSVLYQMEVGDF